MGQRWCTQAREAQSERGDAVPSLQTSNELSDGLEPPLNAKSTEGGLVPEDATIDQINLCVLVHGIEGSSQDMQIWKERIELQHQDWHLLPASSITPTCRVVGDGIDKLGGLLAAEVTEYLNNLRKSTVCLHFICHSLGGLVARAAMPSIMASAHATKLDVKYGHFVSLNSPHLGIRSGHPFTCWKNMGDIIPGRLGLIRLIHQVTLQDRDSKGGEESFESSRSNRKGRPFLEELADASGKHCQALGAFQQRTAVAATHWDVMVPCCTAAICSKNTFPSPSIFTGHLWPFWRLDAAVGFEGALAQHQERAGDAAAEFKRSIDDVQAEQAPLVDQESNSQPGLVRWRKSSDAEVEFRPSMLQGLSSLYWRRVTYTVHFPFADVHLFTIGKDRKLLSWSVEFIDLMIKSIFSEGG